MTITTGSERAVRGYATTYHGTRFRSRLEARWAAFFDLVRWRWVYEPFDTDGWIPDFLIQGPAAFLVEVGPCVDEADFVAKSDKPLGYMERPTLIVGVSPLTLPELSSLGHATHYPAGRLVNEVAGQSGHAWWMSCSECMDDSPGFGRLSIYMDDRDRPCGHQGGRTGEPLGQDLGDLWAVAGNKVQWRSR